MKARRGGPTEAEVEEVLEARPCRRALILLDLHVPELRHLFEIVRGHPDAFLRHDPLLQKGLALVDEGERVALAVIARKLRAPVFRRPVLGVFAGVRPRPDRRSWWR